MTTYLSSSEVFAIACFSVLVLDMVRAAGMCIMLGTSLVDIREQVKKPYSFQHIYYQYINKFLHLHTTHALVFTVKFP